MRKVIGLLLVVVSTVACKGRSQAELESISPGSNIAATDCQGGPNSGWPLQICRQIIRNGSVGVQVVYRGPLVTGNAPVAGVILFLKAKYQGGDRQYTIPMGRSGVPGDPGVAAYVHNGPGADQGMMDLLQWAFRPPLTGNALDLEAAFDGGNGNWDSNNGANYAVHFDERTAN